MQMCYGQNFGISVFRPYKENLNCSVNITCFNLFSSENICLTSVKCAKCGICSTLCWKTWNISGSTDLFEL